MFTMAKESLEEVKETQVVCPMAFAPCSKARVPRRHEKARNMAFEVC